MSGTLPNWMERWLGLANGAGQGTAWRLDSHWPMPPWATLLAVVAAVVVIVAIYLHESPQSSLRYRISLAAIRLSLIGIVAGMIAQLELSLQRTGLPYVAVIVDDSLSMTTKDDFPTSMRASLDARLASAMPSVKVVDRWNLAVTLLSEHDGSWLARLGENYKLRFYYLTGLKASARSDVPGIVGELKSAEPAGESTRLGAAVRGVLDELRGNSPAAIVLLTDGINTEGPTLLEAAAYARRKGVPLYFVGLGSDQPVRDLKLSDLLVDDIVFANDVVNFRFTLTGTGFQGQKVTIALRKDSKPDVLATVVVTVGPDGQPQEVRLPYRPTEVGQFRYSIDVEPPEGGLQTKNPPLVRTIQVRKEKIRVLLAQAYPSFEYRFLRNMLARDETIELHTVLQDADIEYSDEDGSALRVFPVKREEIFSYDVIILGDVNPALLSPAALRNLADFVDQSAKGGALVLLAGPKYMPMAFRDTPLARLMPFDPAAVRYPDPNKPISEGFSVEPTEMGLASPAMQLADSTEESRAIWRNLSPLYWMIEVGDLKPGARVLAETSSASGPDGKHRPVIIMQYVGAGKVLFQTTDETWRWRRRVGDVYFARYWIQTIRDLSRSKLSEGDRSARLSTDRREYRTGDAVRVQARFSDERMAPADDNGVTVVLESEGSKTRREVLHRLEAGRGVFETVLNSMPIGSYHAWIAVPALQGRAPAVDFTIVPPQGELSHVQMDTATMRHAAEATEGRYYGFLEADRLPADLPVGHQVPTENLPSISLWNKWPVILLFLVLLVSEWVLRKWGGMV